MNVAIVGSTALLNVIGQRFHDNLMVILYHYLGPIFSKSTVDIVLKFILTGYIAPMIACVVLIIRKRLKLYIKTKSLIRQHTLCEPDDVTGIRAICRRIAADIHTRKPIVVQYPATVPRAHAEFMGFPYFRSALLISDACQKLTPGQLSGLLAHEMYHIKNHTWKWYWLKVLSDYTLFGNGFLVVLSNSYANELEADRYAANWLKDNGYPPDALIEALQRMALHGSLLRRRPSGSLGSKSGNGPIRNFGPAPGGFKKEWALLFEMYFGDGILSYIHPTMAVRIARIRAM